MVLDYKGKTELRVEINPNELSCDLWDQSKSANPLFHFQELVPRIRGMIWNTGERPRLLHLRLESASPNFTHRIANFKLVPRVTPELLGGSEVDLHDKELFEGRECKLLLHRAPDARAFDIVLHPRPQLGAKPGLIEVRLLVEELVDSRVLVLEELTFNLTFRHAEGRLLTMLPAIYRDEDVSESSFFSRYLLGFEEFFTHLSRDLDSLHHLFSAFGAPNNFVTWLSQWVAMAADLPITEVRRRKLINEAVSLYNVRGTKLGLERLLEICLGVQPIIRDRPTDGFTLGQNAKMGMPQTRLGNIEHGAFLVILPTPDPSAINLDLVKRLIEAFKPVHTRYKCRVIRVAVGDLPEVTTVK